MRKIITPWFAALLLLGLGVVSISLFAAWKQSEQEEKLLGIKVTGGADQRGIENLPKGALLQVQTPVSSASTTSLLSTTESPRLAGSEVLTPSGSSYASTLAANQGDSKVEVPPIISRAGAGGAHSPSAQALANSGPGIQVGTAARTEGGVGFSVASSVASVPSSVSGNSASPMEGNNSSTAQTAQSATASPDSRSAANSSGGTGQGTGQNTAGNNNGQGGDAANEQLIQDEYYRGQYGIEAFNAAEIANQIPSGN